MSMLRLIAAALLLLAPVPGLAQAPQLPAGQVLGNDTASTRTARGASLSAMFDRGISSTRGAILERGAAGWVAITPGTAGLPFVSAGAGADPLYQVLGLSGGGTNNGSIVASNGGIVYSDATKLNILAATATARQMLQSGASGAPAWSTTTYPATTTVNQLLYSSSANVIAGLSTANNGVLNTSGAGVPSITPTPTLGVNGGTGGQITFNGSTSGSVAVRVAAAAGTGTIFQLPADNGTSSYVLQTDGAGITSWVPSAGGGTVTSITCAASLTCTAANPIVASGTIAINLANSNAWTAAQIIDVSSATAFAVGDNGSTNPAFSVVTNVASQATGFQITGRAAGGGLTLATISSGTNENVTFNAKGNGQIALQNSASGAVTIGLPGTHAGLLAFYNATSGSITVQPTTGALGTRTITMPAVTGTMAVTIASGAKALATSAISSGACSAAQTDTATGTLTTDAIDATFSADPTSTTGYSASTNGMLTIIAYPTADTVNFKVCNNTGSSITPGAVTLNWRVRR